MDFSFINDKEWLNLDQETKNQVINYAFKRDIESDPEWVSLSDDLKSNIFNRYKEQAKFEEEKAYAAPERGFIGDVVSNVLRGVADTAELAGYGLKTADPEGGISLGDSIGQKLIDLANNSEKYQIFRPDVSEVEGEGFFKRGVMGGIRSAVPSIGPVGAGVGLGFAFGGPLGALLGGSAATLGLFGLGTYGKKIDEYRNEGIDDKTAHKAALQHALVEGGIEEVSNIVGFLTFGFGKIATQPLKQSAKELLRTPIKTFAKRLAVNTAANELPTELLQSTLGAKIDERIGVLPENSWQEAAIESIIPTITMSVLFGVGAQGLTSIQHRKIREDLNSDNPRTRLEAVNFIKDRITDKELKSAWVGMTTPSVLNNEPIDLTADFSQFKEVEKDITTEVEDNKVVVDNIVNAENVDDAIDVSQQSIDEALQNKEVKTEIIADESIQLEKFIDEQRARQPDVRQLRPTKVAPETKGFVGEVSKKPRARQLIIPKVAPKIPVKEKTDNRRIIPRQPIAKDTILTEEKKKVVGEIPSIITTSPIAERENVKKMVDDGKFVPAKLLRRYPGIVKEEEILEKIPKEIKKKTEPEMVKEQMVEKKEEVKISPLRADENVAQTMIDDFNKKNPEAKLKFDGITNMPEIMKDKPDQITITPQKGSPAEKFTFVINADKLTSSEIEKKYNEKIKLAKTPLEAKPVKEAIHRVKSLDKEKEQVKKDIESGKFVPAKILRKYPDIVPYRKVLDVKPKKEVDFSSREPERLITKPLRDFKKKIDKDISDRVQTMREKVAEYPNWKFVVGDKIKSKKTKKSYKIIAQTWDNKNNRPMYKYESLDGNEKGTFIAEASHKAFDKMGELKPVKVDFESAEKEAGQGIKLSDIQKAFPKQEVFVGDNNIISVHFKNGMGIKIKLVSKLSDSDYKFAIEHGRIKDKETLFAKTEGTTITLDKFISESFDLSHEIKHVLDNLGILTNKDNTALLAKFNSLKQQGKLNFKPSTIEDKTIARREDLANTLAQLLEDRSIQRGSALGKIIQKVLDFFNAIRSIGVMNDRKLAREFESGKIFSRDVRESFDPNKPMFSSAEGRSDQPFDVPDESTRLEDFHYNIIDLLSPVSKLYKAIKKDIPEKSDFLLSERHRLNRSASQLKRAEDKHFTPIKKLMAKYDFDTSQVDEALYSRHAPEANERLKRTNARRFLLDLAEFDKSGKLNEQINALDKAFKQADIPTKQMQESYINLLESELDKVKDDKQNTVASEWKTFSSKPSGMTTEKANKLYKKHSNDFGMQEILNLHDKMIADSLNVSLKSGRINKNEYKALKNTYDYYTPLYREGFEAKRGSDDTGTGLINLRKDYKIRGGSTKVAVNMLGNAMIQHEQSIIRAEKAKSARTFINLVNSNPNKAFWSMKTKQLVNTYDQHGNIVKREDTSIAANEVPLKVDGKYHVIWFNPQNVHGMRIVDHLKGNDRKAGEIVNTLGKFNRMLAMVNTSLNPEFMLTNFARDLQIAAVNLSSTEAKDMKIQVMKDVPKAIKGLHNYLRGDKSSEWGKLAKEFEASGGMMNWIDYTQDVESRVKQLDKDVAEYAGKVPTKKAIKNFGRVIMDYNSIAENATRLAAYKTAKDLGLSKAKSALLGKELTVNFGQKGLYGQLINSLYLFSNAGIQGSFRLLRGLKNSKQAQRMIGGMVTAAVGVSIANGIIGGEDEDGVSYYEQVRDTDKERNIVIMIPDGKGKSVKIPLGWGLNFFWALGTEVGDAILYGAGKRSKYSILDGASRLVNVGMNAFNPLDSATLLQTISPTVIDPITQVAENKTFFGSPLMPERNPFEKVETPESQRFWSSVRPTSKFIAEWANRITGGDKVEKGIIDVSPEVLDLIFDTFTGGMGRFYSDMFSLPIKTFKDETELRDVPVIRKLFGSPDKRKIANEFYENIEYVYMLNEQIKEYPERRKKITKDKTYTLKTFAKNTERRLRKLRKIRDKVKTNEATERINKKIDSLQKKFNKRFILIKER